MSLFDNDRADDQEPIKNDAQDAKTLADGIYFNLPEPEYHALPRLSASGIKEILTSLPTYWARSSMNPDREQADNDSLARQLGRAYHTAIFEPDQLDARFVCEPDPEDFPDALMTDTAVKQMLKEIGQTQTKTGELAADRAERLRASGYDGEIWSVIKGRWEEKRGDRQAIASKYWRQIERDMQRIADNPEVAELVHGGFAEVSILWTCPDSGIPMKARLDKLKADYFLDLKSFANSNGKPVNQFIADQVRFNRYYIQARLYQRAVDMIRDLGLKVEGEAYTPEEHEAHKEIVRQIKSRAMPHKVWYFFQEKNGIPNLLVREIKLQRLPDGVEEQMIGSRQDAEWNGDTETARDLDFKLADSILARKADMEIARAKQLYAQAMEIYGANQPWYPFDIIGTIEDGDFSDYWLDETSA